MSVSRAPKGISTAANSKSTLWDYIAPDPTRAHVFFDDFNRYAAGDWIITTTEAGAGDATEALTSGDGGLLLITNDAADNDLDFFQTPVGSFLMEAGKKAWFKARFKVSDATQSDVVMGLQIIDTTPLAVTDGIWFRKDDGDTHLDFVVQKDDSSNKTTATDIAELADDTFITLGWYFDGVSSVYYFVNDVKLGHLVATNLPDAVLAVSFGIQNGEAVAKTMTLDYVFAAKQR